MSLEIYRIERGLEINQNVQVLEGTGDPGISGDSTTAPLGSIYIDTSTSYVYSKTKVGTGADKWTKLVTKNANEFGDVIVNNGITDRSASTISFDDVTRTCTISPTGAFFEIYCLGKRFEISAPMSVVIPDVEGIVTILFDLLNRTLILH